MIRWRDALTDTGPAAGFSPAHHERRWREPSLARVGTLAEVIDALRTCSPHELRHGLAYRLRSDGVDLGVIRQILGHARLETTVRYGKPTERDVRAAMEERER